MMMDSSSTYDESIILDSGDAVVILVHLPKTWPDVLTGKQTVEGVTLQYWAQITDEALETYGDGLLGIYQHEVVSAFDVTGWERDANGRVIFSGAPSKEFSHLVGTPNPGKHWVRGQSRPVQYLDTAVLRGGSAMVETTDEGRRAVVDGFVLTVDEDGSATLVVPTGQRVTVLTAAS
ncbi:hypothetical protein [Streptomyces sp. NBC_00439]|uniref:hypothetical protein n=1 Tax=unclassified Streptomyces TaxID=2593676 RepID=UPI00224E4B8E|nr:hypothetical protein [Streptomyces sp. NBC_00439]MCX5103581.1 hypothetical protein [Streptomyces sp. NBC_00439]WSX06267.1 hypothetical protein OG355_40800 [Streptomyces sp. NBC_00987]